MRKTSLVAKMTFLLGLRSGTFLMLTLGVPVVLFVIAGISIIQVERSSLPATLGYVDKSGLLSPIPEITIGDANLRLNTYPSEPAAIAALSNRAVSAYFVIPEGYNRGEPISYYGKDDPRGKTSNAIEVFLRRGLAPSTSTNVLDRLGDPLENLKFVATEGGIEARDGFALSIRFAFPYVLAGLFALLLITNVGQLGAAVIREKEQRAMEMVITSMPPLQLVTGKILGVALLSLFQIAFWLTAAAISLFVALAKWAPEESFEVPWDFVGWATVLFIPSYFLYAVLAAGAGVLAGTSRQAQQVAGAFAMFAMAPFFVVTTVMDAPNGPLATGLSLFPLTAPMMILFRMGRTDLPLWQPLLSTVLVLGSIAASIWLVAAMFRSAMLLYGQPWRPKAIFRALRSRNRSGSEGGTL